RTGSYAQTRQGANVYGSWGATGVQRGDQWAKTARVTNRAAGATTRATQTSGGGAAGSSSGTTRRTTGATTRAGNVFAGHDGNVYRNEGGSWQKYDSGNWNNVDRSSTPSDQLNRDFNSRADGAQRTRDLGTINSGTRSNRSFSGAGSYR